VSERRDSQPLREGDVDPDPLIQFRDWFTYAAENGVAHPEAAAVATASADGAPSVRMVLVKQVDERGYVFFTNYEGRKGLELAANPRAALLFYWEPLGRQIRVEGAVTRVSREETVAYATTRPRGSQLGAIASPQSRVIPSREWLEQRVAELDERYAGEQPPVTPQHWGGFRIEPERIEFWQNRSDRLHDRLLYTPDPAGGWRISRLGP
jgi:pyridoxamine 5'-phosphate oxidase